MFFLLEIWFIQSWLSWLLKWIKFIPIMCRRWIYHGRLPRRFLKQRNSPREHAETTCFWNTRANKKVGFNKETLRCYNCHKPGHFAHECTNPANEGSRERALVRVGGAQEKMGVVIERMSGDWLINRLTGMNRC